METHIRRGAGLLVSGLLAVILFTSCGNAPAAQEPLILREEVYPLVPLTREIMGWIRRDNLQVRDFQYYISTGIILEDVLPSDRLVVTPSGDAFRRRNETVRQIQISSTTMGVLASEDQNQNGDTVLHVYFDERWRNVFLGFAESPVDSLYYFMWSEGDGPLMINGRPYTPRYTGENPPYLMIRLKDELNWRVSEDRMRGVPVRKAGLRENQPFPILHPGRAADISVPIVNYARNPIIVSSLKVSARPSPGSMVAQEIVVRPEETPLGDIDIRAERLLTFRVTVPQNSRGGYITLYFEYTDDAGQTWSESRELRVDSQN